MSIMPAVLLAVVLTVLVSLVLAIFLAVLLAVASHEARSPNCGFSGAGDADVAYLLLVGGCDLGPADSGGACCDGAGVGCDGGC